MMTRLKLGMLVAAGLFLVGCEGVAEKAKTEADKAAKKAEDAMKSATDKASDAVKAATDKAGAAVEAAKEKGEELANKGSEIAGQLGEQAMALLGPLKEKIAGLEGLVDKPAELKTVVTELLGTLDSNLANLPVPDAVKTGLTALKEQLTKLLEYLGGNVEPGKIQEYLKTIKDIVGTQLGS
jgi:hypothetical protein